MKYLAPVAVGLALALSAPASALTLGQARRAINIYGSALSKGYGAQHNESINWRVRLCRPHGPNSKHVRFLICVIEFVDEGEVFAHLIVLATHVRTDLTPYHVVAEYGNGILIYAGKLEKG
jgi:hypothetical protein